MLILLGFVVVLLSVFGGYVLAHGQLAALWQPYELLIIGGAAFGAFLVANPAKVAKAVLAGILGLLKGPRYRRDDYVDILSLLYDVADEGAPGGHDLHRERTWTIRIRARSSAATRACWPTSG